jgi:hypothetical protein
MNIQCNYNGETVNIVNIDVNGSQIYVAYINASNNFLVSNENFSTSAGQTAVLLATSATIV